MPDKDWMEAVKRWRGLPEAEQRRRRIEAIPRHVANSMAMEGEPVDEAWIRKRLAHRIRQRATSKSLRAPVAMGGDHVGVVEARLFGQVAESAFVKGCDDAVAGNKVVQ